MFAYVSLPHQVNSYLCQDVSTRHKVYSFLCQVCCQFTSSGVNLSLPDIAVNSQPRQVYSYLCQAYCQSTSSGVKLSWSDCCQFTSSCEKLFV